jgi:hypothetical protein
MRFLRRTVDDPLTLEVDNMRLIKWFIDASYAVHPDMKSHTEWMMYDAWQRHSIWSINQTET